jgi:hypothetical protein
LADWKEMGGSMTREEFIANYKKTEGKGYTDVRKLERDAERAWWRYVKVTGEATSEGKDEG